MNEIICGYCERESYSPQDRYWYIDKKRYPLYVHNSCGVKLVSQGESIWPYHRLGVARTEAYNKQEETKYEQTTLGI